MRSERERAAEVMGRRINTLLRSGGREQRVAAHAARQAVSDGLWSVAAELLDAADGQRSVIGHDLPTRLAAAHEVLHNGLSEEW